MDCQILENDKYKVIRSKEYNLNFDKRTGYSERYGKTFEDDPLYAPLPEILDLEISSGKCMGRCPHCYKGSGDSYYKITLENGNTIFISQQEFLVKNIKISDEI